MPCSLVLWFSTGVTKLHTMFFSWYWQAQKGFQTGCNMKLVSVPCSSKLGLWERGFCNHLPPGEMSFPIISSFKKSGGKGQQLEMEKKMEEYAFPMPAAQNVITVKEYCSFQHCGEKEYHSRAHVVTIYSGSTWTCTNQNTSVSCHISFIQTIEWTIFHYRKLNLKRQSTGFEIVFLYFRRQMWA